MEKVFGTVSAPVLEKHRELKKWEYSLIQRVEEKKKSLEDHYSQIIEKTLENEFDQELEAIDKLQTETWEETLNELPQATEYDKETLMVNIENGQLVARQNTLEKIIEVIKEDAMRKDEE